MANNLPQARLPISEDGKTFSLPWLRFFQGISSGSVDPAIIAALETEIAAAEAAAANAQNTANEALIIAEEALNAEEIGPTYGIAFAALDEPSRFINPINRFLMISGLDGEDGSGGFSLPGTPGSPGTPGVAGRDGLTIPGQDGEDWQNTIGPLNTNLTGAVTSNGSNLTTIQTSIALSGNPTTTTQATTDNSTKIATTAYVTTGINNAIAGVNPAVAVQAATTLASNTSSYTYNNGVSGVGATLTGIANTALIVDGYTFTALGQRLLVKNDTQSPSGAFNGVYYVTQIQTALLPVILTRALDYDMPSDINNTGAIPVVNGTVNALTSWLLTSQVTTVGTDPLTYVLFTSSTAASGANPTAIASNIVVNGSAATFMRSDAAPAIQLASSSQFGLAKVDGTSILASSGVLSTSAGGGSSLVLLEQHTAASSSSLDFTAWYSASYDQYIIEVINIVPSTSADVGFRVSSDSGSTYDSGANYTDAVWYVWPGGQGAGSSSTLTALWWRQAVATGIKAGGSYNGTFKLFNPASTTLFQVLNGQLQFDDTSLDSVSGQFGGLYHPSVKVAINAFRFLPSAGNLISGIVRVYGLAH